VARVENKLREWSPDPGSPRPYAYPGTRMLVNKLGIRNREELEKAERELSDSRIRQLRENPIRGEFDLEHLRAIHRHLFQDVYHWAGELRIIDTWLDNGQKFTRYEDIPRYANRIFASLREEKYLQGADPERFVARAAVYFAHVCRLHPFRQGNGRTQRAFFALLAEQAGYRLDFDLVSKPQMKEASYAGHEGNLAPLIGLFREIMGQSRFRSQGASG